MDVSVNDGSPIKRSGDVIARRRAAKERQRVSGASAATNARRPQVRRRTIAAVAPILWVVVVGPAGGGDGGDRSWLPLSSSEGGPRGSLSFSRGVSKGIIAETKCHCDDRTPRGPPTTRRGDLDAERGTLFRALLNRENE
jgi:hypothetical protein